MIEIKNLRKEFPNAVPIKNINATINDGEVVSIIGPSGTGKSTLLRCINLLTRPTSGQILIDGKDILDPNFDTTLLRQKVGMVFQSYNLFDHYTIIENVMLPSIELLGKSRQEAYDKAIELLHLVGMDGKILQYPDMLSGGQQQRVAIARTLAMDPEIILFDEPTSALDPAMTDEIRSLIGKLKDMGKTILIVTHEMRLAREASTKILFLNKGVVAEEGTPEQIFENPQNEDTRKFVNRAKVFETRIESKEFNFSSVIEQIILYGYKNNVDQKIAHKLQLVFEELCGQILVPKINNPNILFTSEYISSENRMNISVQYNGELFNPLESDNVISLSIINNSIKNATHKEADDGVFTNVFSFDIF